MEAVAGYTTYIELIEPLIAGKQIIRTPMKQEIQRVGAAIDAALSGISCALVSGGDPGIYAMAGLAFEICRKRSIDVIAPGSAGAENAGRALLEVEVVPGIPALCAGAALLGAPLTHDFAVISLSDLLTPWETIENRLAAAAAADFVIVLYNPKSRRRSDHLQRAQRIILQHRSPRTPAGIVRRAARQGQEVMIVSLENLHRAEVDMQSIVYIGSSRSYKFRDYIVTPRGYDQKYKLTV